MKPGSKAYLKFRIKTQQFGIFFFLIGIALRINDVPYSGYLLLTGAAWFGTAKIMQAFEKTYHEPEWERVFPELDESYDHSKLFSDEEGDNK